MHVIKVSFIILIVLYMYVTKFNTLSLSLFVYLCVCVELVGMHSGPITRPLQLKKGIYIYINKTKPFSLCNFLVSGLLHFRVAAHFLVTAFCDFFLRVAAFSGFWIAAFLTAAHVLVAAHFLVATCYDFFLRVLHFLVAIFCDFFLHFLPAFCDL